MRSTIPWCGSLLRVVAYSQVQGGEGTVLCAAVQAMTGVPPSPHCPRYLTLLQESVPYTEQNRQRGLICHVVAT